MIKAGRTGSRRQRANGGANVTEGQGEDDATEGQEPPPDDKTENDAAKIYTVIYLLCNLPWPHVVVLGTCGCLGCMWWTWLHVVTLSAYGCIACMWSLWLHGLLWLHVVAVAACRCLGGMCLPWLHSVALAACGCLGCM